MSKLNKLTLLLLPALLSLACTLAQQTPQSVEVEQLAFEVQTATPTVSLLVGAPTNTPDPNATPTLTATATLTAAQTLTATAAATATTAADSDSASSTVEPTTEPPPQSTVAPVSPPPTPTTAAPPTAEPLRGGEWDFEAGFAPWGNPFGDNCDGSGLATGWTAFTTRDEYGSSCMNQTTWQDNVYSGGSAQEITFAFVGNQAGIFKTAPVTPGHRYTVEAFTKREFSPAKVEVSLGLDPSGGGDWLAESVQWFPWDEDVDDAWARTEETIVATGEALTIFIRGSHPYPEAGGALRIDSVSVTDQGPAE